MTESTATKVGVPGDKRLGDLKVNKPVPWYGKLPVVRDLKIAVGWQKAMLVTGLVITGVFLLVAVFAPLIAPYGYSQIKDADGVSFPTQAAPSSKHIWGTTVGGFDVFSRTVWGARTAVIAIIVAVLLSIFAGVLLGLISWHQASPSPWCTSRSTSAPSAPKWCASRGRPTSSRRRSWAPPHGAS